MNEELNAKEQSIAKIAALTCTGNTGVLKNELNDGLDAGLTINEIKEVLVQLYAYCGFPRSLNAINTFMKILEERKTKVLKMYRAKTLFQFQTLKINMMLVRKIYKRSQSGKKHNCQEQMHLHQLLILF